MKNIEIEFRKLFSMPEEGEYSFAIIRYRYFPLIMRVSMGVDEKGFAYQYVAQYRKSVKMDLWLCEICYTWLTKEIIK